MNHRCARGKFLSLERSLEKGVDLPRAEKGRVDIKNQKRCERLVLLDVSSDIDGLLDGKRLSSGSRLGRDQEVGEKKKKNKKKEKRRKKNRHFSARK